MTLSAPRHVRSALLCLALAGLYAISLPEPKAGESVAGNAEESSAEESSAEKSPVENPEANRQESSTSTSEERRSPDTTDTRAPEPGNLRRKDISEAFEQFSPSEEISADNAVPFPTDI